MFSEQLFRNGVDFLAHEIKEKVSSLEKALEDFIRHTDLGFAKVQNALIEQKQSMEDFKEEMQKFKEEMRLSRERSEKEMQEFKEEMRRSYERSEKGMQEFKEEMRRLYEHSKKEMHKFKEEILLSRERSEKGKQKFKEEMSPLYERSEKGMQDFKAEMNKKWGELTNRLGTLAEDFVAPNIPPIARKYFGCPEEADFFVARCKKRHSKDKAKVREFDAIAVYEDKVILNETKSTPRQQYLDDFAALLPSFFEYFPEFSGRELIPIFSSLYVDERTVEYATGKGIYVLAIKGDTMDLLNYDRVKKM